MERSSKSDVDISQFQKITGATPSKNKVNKDSSNSVPLHMLVKPEHRFTSETAILCMEYLKGIKEMITLDEDKIKKMTNDIFNKITIWKKKFGDLDQ